MIVWFQVDTIIIITTEDYFSLLACLIVSLYTVHFTFFNETFKCCCNINNMCCNAYTVLWTDLVDRSKVYFAVCGAVVQWLVLLPYSKSIFEYPPRSWGAEFPCSPYAHMSISPLLRLPPTSKFMKVAVEHVMDEVWISGSVDGPGCDPPRGSARYHFHNCIQTGACTDFIKISHLLKDVEDHHRQKCNLCFFIY